MRAFWSRAAQSQLPGTCRCSSCISNANAIVPVRRRGEAGLRGPWAFGTPTSTFLYTTLFAAGLTVDAKAKLDRNRQWDEAFAQLPVALSPLDTTSSTTSKPPSGNQSNGHPEIDEGPKDSEWAAAHRCASTEVQDSAASVGQAEGKVDATANAEDNMGFDSRMPGTPAPEWPPNTGRAMKPHNLPPQSLWAPNILRWAAIRRRHTRKKVAMQELATGLLIHELIRHSNLRRYLYSAKSRLQDLSPPILEHITSDDDAADLIHTAFVTDIERLRLTDVGKSDEEIAQARTDVDIASIPSYVQDADGDFYGICKQMNDGIRQLLQQRVQGDDKEKALAIAKICHNLLISTAPPDVQTFNTLISGLLQWRRPRLVDAVIEAFHTSKIRPNEITCEQILHHYMLQSRPKEFSRFVAQMRGVRGALMLANPSITVNEASEGRLSRVDVNKVYQKVHPTPMVFAALIDGVRKFAGFDRALDVYYEMKADGWGLPAPALIKLLGDCIRRADWEGGTYVWGEINSIKSQASSRHMAKAYHHMLSLCSVTGNTIGFNQVLNEVAKRGLDQKYIIKAAMKTTAWAQHKKDNLAPPWAADNLMIAVSGYINDAKQSDEHADGRFHEDADAEEEVADSTLSADSSPSDGKPFDPMEAWSSWLEHELGERPKDPEL